MYLRIFGRNVSEIKFENICYYKLTVNEVVKDERVLLDKTGLNVNLEISIYKNDVEKDEILSIEIKLDESSVLFWNSSDFSSPKIP